MGRPKGSTQVTTPLKCQISRDFNLRGGVGTHGAAAATAEEFGLTKSNGPSQVLKYDAQVRDGTASRSNRPHTGRNSAYNSEFGERITGAFNAEATTTYREVAKDLEKAEATVRRWAKEKLGYRSLNQTVRPTVSRGGAKRVHEDSGDRRDWVYNCCFRTRSCTSDSFALCECSCSTCYRPRW